MARGKKEEWYEIGVNDKDDIKNLLDLGKWLDFFEIEITF